MKELQPLDKRPSIPHVPGKLSVCKKQCRECLFGSKPHLPWMPAGKAKIDGILKVLNSGKVEGSAFNCHEYDNVMCHGFWIRHGKDSWYGRLASHGDHINWVE